MGKKHKSPAKIARSIFRLLEYKQAFLEDCWGTEIETDKENKKIIWKASKMLNLTLKKSLKIVETRSLYNRIFPSLPFGEKLALFQNMWKPDHDSFNFFTCMHEHLRRGSIQCNNFCGAFGSPACGHLAFFLKNNTWPST